MLREMLKSKIHRATVTGSDLNYEGSISIDQDLQEAAGLLPNEAVHIWNVTNGARFMTYVITAERGSCEICLNGGAARHVQRGDILTIAAFCHVDETEIASHRPRVVVVDEANRLLVPSHAG
jgi:aspartate 1-decarboxylase